MCLCTIPPLFEVRPLCSWTVCGRFELFHTVTSAVALDDITGINYILDVFLKYPIKSFNLNVFS